MHHGCPRGRPYLRYTYTFWKRLPPVLPLHTSSAIPPVYLHTSSYLLEYLFIPLHTSYSAPRYHTSSYLLPGLLGSLHSGAYRRIGSKRYRYTCIGRGLGTMHGPTADPTFSGNFCCKRLNTFDNFWGGLHMDQKGVADRFGGFFTWSKKA